MLIAAEQCLNEEHNPIDQFYQPINQPQTRMIAKEIFLYKEHTHLIRVKTQQHHAATTASTRQIHKCHLGRT
jgi:hypothetical protein